MRLRTHEEAIREAREARKWYRDRSRVGEQAFATSYRGARERLAKYPRSGRVLYGDVRSLQLREVPYSLIYRIDGGLVFIVALAHGKRDPGYWNDRLR